MKRHTRIEKLVESLLELGVAPGVVVRVGRKGKTLLEKAYGHAALLPRRERLSVKHVFDMASLTKVVATTSAVAVLVGNKVVELDTPLSSVLPALRGGDKERITVRQALAHCGGFKMWHPFYLKARKARDPAAYVAEAAAGLSLSYPPGAKTVYSDQGFILLGAMVEALSGQALDVFVRERVFHPLGMKDSCFRPLNRGVPLKRIVPTEKCPWRKKVVRGEVHDENAWAMGGVAGHAGLFGTAADLAAFAEEVLRAAEGKGKVLPRGYREFMQLHPCPGGSRALGWDTPGGSLPTGGRFLSKGAVGMTGFTGTSLWVDPARDAYIIVLTNRVHPRRENDLYLAARPFLHDVLVKELLS